MRAITHHELVAVVGGADQAVVITKKKDDGSGAGTLQLAVGVHGANSAGAAAGGAGGGAAASPKYSCVETIEQTCQTAQFTKFSFGVQGATFEQTPGGCVVKQTSVCTPISQISR
ncbi:hypothetical protein RugamoR64_44200 [Duganella rhizosphaerae]|uniref:hypothetical protein n=1 Tax=Duganella rhizosphaerae TaxID=2885763 RepID=UPI0030E89E92